MAKNELTIIAVDDDPSLTLDELCEACHITPEFVVELVHYGVVDIEDIKHPVFNGYQLQRIRRLLRLQRDLEVNLAGAILAVELLEQIEAMERKIRYLS
jgi:chaperone modulatory protein CbpM